MSIDQQIELANFIKSVHIQLRESSREKGSEIAWNEHKENFSNLERYSKSMQKLALIWESKATNKIETKKCVQSRIEWIIKQILNYFNNDLILRRKKEFHLLSIWYKEDFQISENYVPLKPISVLDVGSCYNPLKNVLKFNTTAIDLYPNKDFEVFQCDFLELEISENIKEIKFENNKINVLPSGYYESVIFSLYLEYLPTSKQRIQSCEKAFKLLKQEGILIIVTPDSDHVGKNAKIMKNWRYTLGKLGFLRIKFEKLDHLTCMVFRKTIDSRISNYWSDIHKKEYMNFSLDIPQDKKFQN